MSAETAASGSSDAGEADGGAIPNIPEAERTKGSGGRRRENGCRAREAIDQRGG